MGSPGAPSPLTAWRLIRVKGLRSGVRSGPVSRVRCSGLLPVLCSGTPGGSAFGWTARRTSERCETPRSSATDLHGRGPAAKPWLRSSKLLAFLPGARAPSVVGCRRVAPQESHVGDADGFRGRGDVNAEHGAPNAFKLKPVKASCSYYRLASRAFRGSTFWAFAAPSIVGRRRGGGFDTFRHTGCTFRSVPEVCDPVQRSSAY